MCKRERERERCWRAVSQILHEQLITFVLCLYFVLYPALCIILIMHALKFPLQSRECLDKDNINVCAVSLGSNRFTLSLSQTGRVWQCSCWGCTCLHTVKSQILVRYCNPGNFSIIIPFLGSSRLGCKVRACAEHDFGRCDHGDKH